MFLAGTPASPQLRQHSGRLGSLRSVTEVSVVSGQWSARCQRSAFSGQSHLLIPVEKRRGIFVIDLTAWVKRLDSYRRAPQSAHLDCEALRLGGVNGAGGQL